MKVSDHLDALKVEGRLLAAAAASAGLNTPVPSCPGWVVRDLVRHQGGVHRWATSVVVEPRTGPWDVELDEVVGAWPSDAELLGWFEDGHAALVASLAEADPDLVCWTFLAAPSPLAMWARRQAHETTVHRVDAELAAHVPLSPIAASFANDGIDELLACFITRPAGQLRSDPPRSIRFRCTDTDGDWLVRIAADRVETISFGSDRADCEVVASASDLYLALWSRQSAVPLRREGDDQVLELFLDRVHVRWS